MDLRWIDDFIVLARTRNFSRASEERNLTQSAFSRRIKALEDWAGVTLMERSVPVALTEEGRAFLDVVDPLSRQLHNLRGMLQAKGRSDRKAIVFALPHTVSITVLPALLQQFDRMGIGRLPLRVVTDEFEPLVALFAAGGANFLGLYGHPEFAKPTELTKCESVLVGREKLVPVSAPSATGGVRYELPGSAKSPIPALMISESSLLGRALVYDMRVKFQPCWLNFTTENTLAFALKPLVEQGAGMAWLPESLIAAELASGKLVRSGDDFWSVVLDLRFYRGASLRTEAESMIWSAIEKFGVSGGE